MLSFRRDCVTTNMNRFELNDKQTNTTETIVRGEKNIACCHDNGVPLL